MMKRNQRPRITFILAATTTLCLLYIITLSSINNGVDCAPTTTNSKTKNTNASKSTNNRLVRPGILSGLFRRQTSSSSSSANDDDSNEPPTQTEIDAQKFMDSLPNVGSNSNNQGPTTFRERVSESFGVLRDGVNNQFRSLRDNFSETVEDLRDTWSSGQE